MYTSISNFYDTQEKIHKLVWLKPMHFVSNGQNKHTFDEWIEYIDNVCFLMENMLTDHGKRNVISPDRNIFGQKDIRTVYEIICYYLDNILSVEATNDNKPPCESIVSVIAQIYRCLDGIHEMAYKNGINIFVENGDEKTDHDIDIESLEHEDSSDDNQQFNYKMIKYVLQGFGLDSVAIGIACSRIVARLCASYVQVIFVRVFVLYTYEVITLFDDLICLFLVKIICYIIKHIEENRGVYILDKILSDLQTDQSTWTIIDRLRTKYFDEGIF